MLPFKSCVSLVLVIAVAVFLDVLLKLRAEGLEKEEADKAGSSDLASTAAEDLSDRVDDRHEGEEGEDDDEHDDGAEGFQCSDSFQRLLRAKRRLSSMRDSARIGMNRGLAPTLTALAGMYMGAPSGLLTMTKFFANEAPSIELATL